MNILLATGCPYSGWNEVLPVLRQMGIESKNEAFSVWYDELFNKAGITDVLKINHVFQPDNVLADKAASLFKAKSDFHLLCADSRGLWLLDFLADNFSEVRFLLFYTRAEKALAHAIQQGLDPESFMEAWRVTNTELIRFQRRHRNCSVLIDAEAAIHYPSAFSNVIQSIGVVPSVVNFSSSIPGKGLVLEHLLARQHLNDQFALESLQCELEASAQPLGEPINDESQNLTAIFQSYWQWQKQKEELEVVKDKLHCLEEENKEQSQENELLLLQLHQVQEELEHYFLKYQAIEKELEAKRVLEESRELDVLVKVKETLAIKPSRTAAPFRVFAKLFTRTSKAQYAEKRQVDLLKASGLFDEAWYLFEYPDVAEAGIDPVVHYLRFGAEEGRNPSPKFDTTFYLSTNPDVASSEINPLVHYIRFGVEEGRKAFSPRY